jgi:hypothetical protein
VTIVGRLGFNLDSDKDVTYCAINMNKISTGCNTSTAKGSPTRSVFKFLNRRRKIASKRSTVYYEGPEEKCFINVSTYQGIYNSQITSAEPVR